MVSESFGARGTGQIGHGLTARPVSLRMPDMRLASDLLFYVSVAAYVLIVVGAIVYTVAAWIDVARYQRDPLEGDPELTRVRLNRSDQEPQLPPE